MAKSKTFKSEHDGRIVVAVPGREPVTFEPGKTHETDEQAVIDALSANPDLSEVKGKKS
jgi:hypothetical protein